MRGLSATPLKPGWNNARAPFQDHEDPDWFDAFIAATTTTESWIPGGIRYTGECPRCTHTIELDYPMPSGRLFGIDVRRYDRFGAGGYRGLSRRRDDVTIGVEADGEDTAPAPAAQVSDKQECNCGKPHARPAQGKKPSNDQTENEDTAPVLTSGGCGIWARA